jgi:hypothetical protein
MPPATRGKANEFSANPAFVGDYQGYVFDVRSIAVADTFGKNETSLTPC